MWLFAATRKLPTRRFVTLSHAAMLGGQGCSGQGVGGACRGVVSGVPVAVAVESGLRLCSKLVPQVRLGRKVGEACTHECNCCTNMFPYVSKD